MIIRISLFFPKPWQKTYKPWMKRLQKFISDFLFRAEVEQFEISFGLWETLMRTWLQSINPFITSSFLLQKEQILSQRWKEVWKRRERGLNIFVAYCQTHKIFLIVDRRGVKSHKNYRKYTRNAPLSHTNCIVRIEGFQIPVRAVDLFKSQTTRYAMRRIRGNLNWKTKKKSWAVNKGFYLLL